MASGATESTHESSFFTRVSLPDQQPADPHGSTVDVGSCVHVPDQEAVGNDDTTRGISSINSTCSIAHCPPDGEAAQAQGTTHGIASSMHALDSQAVENGESTQEFTAPPHGPPLQDTIHDPIASASTDIPDRQPIRDDEITQELTASTIRYVPDGRATGDQEAAQDLPASALTDLLDDGQVFKVEESTQEFTASTIIQIPDRQALRDDETTQDATALRPVSVSAREAIEDGGTAPERTDTQITYMIDGRAIGHEKTTRGLTASRRNTDAPGAIRESTASSLTHSSDGHAAEAQETVQEEVPISTSFAANLPDRQVVEADALTPPPPLTITTPRSSVLTHVTGTQVIEARREDNQPLRAGSTSHAASMQEVAAAASSSPEVRTVSRSTELPKQDDERQSEIGKEMINVSATVPSARLIIAYNRRFIAGDDELSKDVVRHPRTASGWDLISVVQGAKHADFVLNLSYHNRPVDEAVGRFIPFSLSLQIIFQPASDSCVLSNRGGAKFHLEHLEASCSCARNSIDSMQCHVLLPGMWRILTRGEKPHEDEEYSLVQWLILPRKFCASVDGESTKRQKLSGTNLVRRHQDMEVLVKDLEDGQSARIRRVPGDTADYELRRIEHIASTASACVFACRHSKVAGALAIKVIDYDVNSVNQFNRRAAAHLTTLVAAWKREVSFLRSLKHVSPFLSSTPLVAHVPPSLTSSRSTSFPSRLSTAVCWPFSWSTYPPRSTVDVQSSWTRSARKQSSSTYRPLSYTWRRRASCTTTSSRTTLPILLHGVLCCWTLARLPRPSPTDHTAERLPSSLRNSLTPVPGAIRETCGRLASRCSMCLARPRCRAYGWMFLCEACTDATRYHKSRS